MTKLSQDVSASLSEHVRNDSATLNDSRLTEDIPLDAEIQLDQFQMTGLVQNHFEEKQ